MNEIFRQDASKKGILELNGLSEGVERMIGGAGSIPSWFYIVAFAVVLLVVLFIEWKTR